MAINLTAKDKAQEVLFEYLVKNASDVLVEKINNGTPYTKDGVELINKKTLETFMRYAADEAKKQAEKGANFAMVGEDIIFGWMMHYFQEDEIVGTLYNQDGSEYKPVVTPVANKTTTVKPKTVTKKKSNEGQMSLFDNFDDDVGEQPQVAPPVEPVVVENTQHVSSKTQGTPLFQEYAKYVEMHPGCVIAYRVGDFYEVLGKNAVALADELELTLTGRDVGLEKRLPMIGFPYHRKEFYFEEISRKHKLVIVENKVATVYVNEVDSFDADLDVLQDIEQNGISTQDLESDVDDFVDSDGVLHNDEYKAIETLSNLLGKSIIVR